jgi:HD-GYP domain-containing protein (c-di-GMP phosphodiesterase class II)
MLKLIPVSKASVGMYIQELKGNWLSNPFWKSSFKIESLADLKKLQTSEIKMVVIDTTKGLDVVEDQPEEVTQQDQDALALVEPSLVVESQQVQSDHADDRRMNDLHPVMNDHKAPNLPVSASEERASAQRAIAASKQAVASMFNDVRMGKAINTEAALPIVEELTASVSRNQGALISLVRLKTQDDYTYMHSVAVCALMVALAKQLNLSKAETRQAGLAGLMHDIGKAAIPQEVLNKPGALTDEEFALVKLHPQRGHDLLLQAQVQDSATLDVCLHHHEKVDGSGYPDRLTTDQISLFAKMGAVCDVYDAITSNRPYKAGWEPGISLQRMAQWKNHFDETVFKAFVKSVGIYPIGTVVKLKSGRLGVVVDQTSKSLLKPMVKAFFLIQSKEYLTPEIVDLSDAEVDDEILGQEDPLLWGIQNISSYWAE